MPGGMGSNADHWNAAHMECSGRRIGKKTLQWSARVAARCACIVTTVCLLCAAEKAFGTLQNIEIGGSLQIHAHYYTAFFEPEPVIRIPETFTQGRPLGPFGTESEVRGLRRGGDGVAYIEQRTTLHLRADFTGDVAAFVEFDSIHDWGEDFRSDYLGGRDWRADSSDDVEIYQAYLEVTQFFRAPLRLRIGRQELYFGSGWLVSNNPVFEPMTYLSFDAVRLTWEQGVFCVDVFWSKLAERWRGLAKGDVDFSGIYATCAPLEALQVDAYYFFLLDGERPRDTSGPLLQEWVERLRGLDNYPKAKIHTVGVRLAGEWRGLDYEAEAAYQWGDAATAGAGFAPHGYGDPRARYDNWAAQATLGYTFDIRLEPRIYISGIYYGGEDRRNISFWDWINPFHRPRASISFNRLFSDWKDDIFFDSSALSNVWKFKTGASLNITESLEAALDLTYTGVVDAFDTPVLRRVGPYRAPIAFFPFVTSKGAKDLGFEVCLSLGYDYSESLRFE
ncbi:MAG TPA: hypothetical protein ENN65_02085, partial [Candidatus Hydrogenedentes bacterium]|nr:hypothetical protein [Candidatus Hydrogenedentota bacterium]